MSPLYTLAPVLTGALQMKYIINVNGVWRTGLLEQEFELAISRSPIKCLPQSDTLAAANNTLFHPNSRVVSDSHGSLRPNLGVLTTISHHGDSNQAKRSHVETHTHTHTPLRDTESSADAKALDIRKASRILG